MTSISAHEKKCSRCGECWPADAEFFRLRLRGTGQLYSWCRACEAEQKALKRKGAPVPAEALA